MRRISAPNRKKKQHTSIRQKDLDAQVGITDAQEEQVLDLVELQVVVPDVADQLADLVLQGLLVGAGRERLDVLGVRDVEGDVGVDDAEAVLARPVYVVRHAVELFV